jgi:tetratricopeptide (TPR) repeat protein
LSLLGNCFVFQHDSQIRAAAGQTKGMSHRKFSRHLFLSICPSVFACIVFAVATPRAALAQVSSQSISVETSQQIFAVMCALDAAGFDANSTTLDIYPAHAALRARLLQLNGPATRAIRDYYKKHEFVNSDETLSPFLSFALVVGPPPTFPFVIAHSDIPPAVTSIDDFGDLLHNFYVEAHLDREWAAVQPEADAEVARLTDPMRQVVFRTTAYLRELEVPYTTRTFTVFVEPLVGNRVNIRNIGNRYAMIVGPGPVLPMDSIRHGYLHFILDPLTLRYQQVISTRRDLLQVANRAPQLPLGYHDDFVGLFDECLVRAAELRLEKLPADRLESILHQDDRTGFILVRPLYQQMIVFERSEPAMTFYFPSLVQGINLNAEVQRFQNFQFADASEKIDPGGVTGEGEANASELALEQELLHGDRQIATQDGKGAAATFQEILTEHPNLPRAVYGLAIASVLEGQGQKAETLFEQIVHTPVNSVNSPSAPGPDILAWAHVYLGRMNDLRGNRQQAQDEYRAALAVSGAPEQARVAAQRGLNMPYSPPPKGAQP